MFVEGVQLVDGLRPQFRAVVQLRLQSPQELAALPGALHAALGHRAVLDLLDRGPAHGRAPPAAGLHRCADHEPLVLQHPQVVSRGVHRQPGLHRQFLDQQTRGALDGMQQQHAAALGQSSEVVDAAWHGVILGSRAEHSPHLVG